MVGHAKKKQACLSERAGGQAEAENKQK